MIATRDTTARRPPPNTKYLVCISSISLRSTYGPQEPAFVRLSSPLPTDFSHSCYKSQVISRWRSETAQAGGGARESGGKNPMLGESRRADTATADAGAEAVHAAITHANPRIPPSPGRRATRCWPNAETICHPSGTDRWIGEACFSLVMKAASGQLSTVAVTGSNPVLPIFRFLGRKDVHVLGQRQAWPRAFLTSRRNVFRTAL